MRSLHFLLEMDIFIDKRLNLTLKMKLKHTRLMVSIDYSISPNEISPHESPGLKQFVSQPLHQIGSMTHLFISPMGRHEDSRDLSYETKHVCLLT